jgi:hypothetical protein
MAERYDRTFQLRQYPLPKLVVECIKYKRTGRFDRVQLIEKLGETYPVHDAVDRLTKDWECEKPDRIKAYALHPNAMYCLPHLPEWQKRADRFWWDVNNGRKPEPLFGKTELK